MARVRRVRRTIGYGANVAASPWRWRPAYVIHTCKKIYSLNCAAWETVTLRGTYVYLFPPLCLRSSDGFQTGLCWRLSLEAESICVVRAVGSKMIGFTDSDMVGSEVVGVRGGR